MDIESRMGEAKFGILVFFPQGMSITYRIIMCSSIFVLTISNIFQYFSFNEFLTWPPPGKLISLHFSVFIPLVLAQFSFSTILKKTRNFESKAPNQQAAGSESFKRWLNRDVELESGIFRVSTSDGQRPPGRPGTLGRRREACQTPLRRRPNGGCASLPRPDSPPSRPDVHRRASRRQWAMFDKIVCFLPEIFILSLLGVFPP